MVASWFEVALRWAFALKALRSFFNVDVNVLRNAFEGRSAQGSLQLFASVQSHLRNRITAYVRISYHVAFRLELLLSLRLCLLVWKAPSSLRAKMAEPTESRSKTPASHAQARRIASF